MGGTIDELCNEEVVPVELSSGVARTLDNVCGERYGEEVLPAGLDS